MQKRIASTGLAVALAIGAVLVAAAPAQASSEESRFTYLTNHERSSRGIRTLVVQSDLVAIARRHSEQMAARGYIYHNENLPNEVGGNWTELGENVGKGGSVDSIHDAFMNSAPHRANILRTSFNQIGIGTAIKDGYIYVTEVFAARGGSTYHPVYRPRSHTTHTYHSSSSPHAVPRPRVRRARAAGPAESPVTMSLLIRLLGLDARQVNPATGAALGI